MSVTIENLESRRLSSATLKSAVLRVAGTRLDDVIALQMENGRIVVRTNGVREGAFPASAVRSIIVEAGNGHDYVTLARTITRSARLFGGAGDDTLVGAAGNDTIDGGDGDDVLRGRAGNDRVTTGSGVNSADAGEGVDTIDYSSATDGVVVDLIDGHGYPDRNSPGNPLDRADWDNLISFEIANGGAGNDSLYGGRRMVAAYGNGGDDYLGADDQSAASLFGGAGNDYLNGAKYAANILDGGEGTDEVSYLSWYDAIVYVSLDDLANDGFKDEKDNVLNVENVRGGLDGSYLVGNAQNNVLAGDSRSDTIFGGGGNDTLRGDWGSDSLDGGEGDDELRGSIGDDTLTGGPGRDTLNGDEGNDRFYARDGSRDIVDGGEGNDRALVDYDSGGDFLFVLGDRLSNVEFSTANPILL
jgi:Ca2+-binding RTX toxin-like protein